MPYNMPGAPWGAFEGRIFDQPDIAACALEPCYAVGRSRALCENIGCVAVDGTRGVINEGTRVPVMDLADPANPIYMGYVDVGAIPTTLAISGNYAYSAATNGKIHVIEVSNASAPIIRGTVAGDCWAGNTSYVRRAGDYLYIGQCESLLVIDIRTKTSPTIVRRVSASHCVDEMAGDGGYLYFSTGATRTLSIFSLVTPADPFLLSTCTLSASWAGNIGHDMVVFGDILYIGNGSNTMVVDIIDLHTIALQLRAARIIPSIVGPPRPSLTVGLLREIQSCCGFSR